MTARRGWQLGVLLLFLIVAYQVARIDAIHMRPDEEIAYRSTRGSFGDTVSFQANSDVQGPLWFAAFWGWQQLVGEGEFMGRLLSIYFSALTLTIVYQIGRRWFGGARFGLYALVVLGVNLYFFIYSLEIRPYALVMLAATASMLAFQRWLERDSWRWAAFYGVMVAAMLYIHYFTAFLVLAQMLYFVAGRPAWARWKEALGAAALAFALWLPWLPIFFRQLETLKRIEEAAGNARGSFGIGTTTQATTLPVVEDLLRVATNGLAWLYALLLLVGLAYLWRRADYRLALLWALGVPLIALSANLVAAVYTERYVAYLSVGLALALGAGLAMLPGRFGIVALAGFAAASLWALPGELPQRTPYRHLFGALVAEALPGDRLYFDHVSTAGNFMRWQVEHYLPDELLANSTSDRATAQAARRVWHIADGDWFATPAVRENFAAIEATHPRQLGFGRCGGDWCLLLQLLEAPPQSEPTLFGERMAFWGVDVDSVTPDSIQTRLWWRVEAAPPVDYSIALHVLDENSVSVAQFDGPIDHFGDQIVATSQLEPGRVYVDFRAVALPPDLPPGDYQLALVVYQWWDGARLELANGADMLPLASVEIGEAG